MSASMVCKLSLLAKENEERSGSFAVDFIACRFHIVEVGKVTPNGYAGLMLLACLPLGPVVTSKVTFWPSFRVLKPFA